MDKAIEALEGWADQGNESRKDTIKLVRRAVLASMETGQQSRARTLIRELAEVSAQDAYTLRADVVAGYGIDI